MSRDLWVDTGKGRLAVRVVEGETPPVVLLHGFGQNLAAWDAVIEELHGVAQLVSYDLPGHGLSDARSAVTFGSLIEDLDAIVANRHLQQPIIVGHSLGAGVAIAYAASRACGGLIALDGAVDDLPADHSPPDWAAMEMAIRADPVRGFVGDRDALDRLVRDPGREPKAWWGSVLRRGVQPGVDGLYRFRPQPADLVAVNKSLMQALVDRELTTDIFEHLSCPSAFVFATDQANRGMTEERARVLAARGFAVHLWDCGHDVPAYKPRETAALVARFVAAARAVA
jgi:pimeloyl-ACP methyl ester carboxylesterase